MVTMSLLKSGYRLPHILTLAPGTGYQVHNKGTVTIYVLLDVVALLGVSTLEGLGLLHHRAGDPAIVAFETTRILNIPSSSLTDPSHKLLQISWLLCCNLKF